MTKKEKCKNNGKVFDSFIGNWHPCDCDMCQKEYDYESEKCIHCGQHPSEGACFHCKMD